jgi:hypothetical protein
MAPSGCEVYRGIYSPAEGIKRQERTTSTAFPNFRPYGSCGVIDLIVPSVDDGVAVEIINEFHDVLFQLVFRADADVAEHGASGFGEEPLDEIEPRAVLGGEHELKASFKSRCQVSRETCAE